MKNESSIFERWKMLKYQYMSIRDTLAKKKLVNSRRLCAKLFN